jgi:AraC-like DNA-binding protein
MVCGFVESSEFLFLPVFRSLPALSVERTTEDNVGALISSTTREIVASVDRAVPGTQAVLGRLMELLFIELLRRQAAKLPAGTKGWFGALGDPIVSRALQLLHEEPARRWTVDEIAARIGSSRSVLSERFKSLIGRPPIDYLASWRIQLASERLRLGHEAIPSIAASVGYESEAAFNRAFKRITGMTPGSWRQRNPAAQVG